jgi:hypothetical protein
MCVRVPLALGCCSRGDPTFTLYIAYDTQKMISDAAPVAIPALRSPTLRSSTLLSPTLRSPTFLSVEMG